MSKIEEALRRARAERAEDSGATGQPQQPPPTSSTPSARDRERRDGTHSRLLRDRHRGDLVGVTAAEQIARMKDDFVRERVDMACRRIIDKDMADARVADAFRHLRTSLFQRASERNSVIMVTSVTSGGGSSFVSLNLGAAIAFDEGATALLLDCNLHNPSLGQLVNSEDGAAGLTDYLAGREAEVAKIIHPVGIPRLRVVPAGRQNPSAMEYFTAPQLGALLRELRQRYRERSILLDAPPITEAADARILAALCDYVVLVVPYGRVTAAQVASAAQAVGQEKLIGCVLNSERRIPALTSRTRASGWA